MSSFKLITVFFLFCSSLGFGQNRVFERPLYTGHSIFMDSGEGQTLIAMEHRFGWDSSHVHLLSANSDMVLSHLGGFRMIGNLTWLNDAAMVNEGVILGGANLAFSTRPYVMRMGISGEVLFNNFFYNLDDGQDQIVNTFVDGNDLDLFTWSDNTRLSYYMLNGSIDGSFPLGLQIHAPEEMEFRTDEVASTENENEYMVICQADTNNTGSRFLIVSRLNPNGVLWSYMHDHSVNEVATDSEFSYGLKQLSDGNWIYLASYTNEDGNNRRMVKMEGDGNVLWSKEYFLNGEKLTLSFNYETSDGGLLQHAVVPSSSETLIVKLDANGVVQWSKKYVPSLTSVAPTGFFFKNDQGQLYSFNSFVLAEIDEEFNSCDFEPHSGITSSNVTFDIVAVSHETNNIVPEIGELPFEMLEESFENTLICLSTGVEENENVQVNIYPNPASDFLKVDLSNFQNEVFLSVVDMQGRVLKTELSIRKDAFAIDVKHLKSGVYLLRIESAELKTRTRFVKN